MANFKDFYDFIMPVLRGVDPPMVDFELRKAIRDWQRSTTMWRESVPLTFQPGVTDYRIEARDGGLIAGILSMPRPNDPSKDMPSVTESHRWPEGYLPEPGTPDGWWQLYPGVIRINRPPDVAYPVTVLIYKQLTQDPSDDYVPDDLYEDYAEKVASGALAQFFAMPAKPWRDTSMASYHMMNFTKAKQALRAKVRRGGATAQPRVKGPTFAGRIR